MPAPVVTRLIEVEYAGLVLGGSGNYQIHGFHELEGEYGQLTLVVDVVVRDTTTAGCKTLAAALEAAWEKPDQDLRVTIDGQAYVSLTQAGHTGMNGQPSWQLLQTHRSKKSRLYRCRVTVLRPATLTGKGGRQSARWSLHTDDVGIRTLTIRATYTALPGTGSATTVIAANFATYAGEVQTSIGGEWEEPLSYEVEPDHNDKIASVTAVYREVVYPQSGSATDDPKIVNPEYSITTYRLATPQLAESGAAEPVSITVTFGMGFRVALVDGDDLRDTVENLVIEYLERLVSAHSNAPSAPVLVEKNVRIDPVTNRASGVCTFVAFSVSLVRASLRRKNYTYTGNAFAAVMDGRPFSRDHHPSPGIKRRTVVLTTIELWSGGTFADDISQRPIEAAKRQAISEGFWLIDEDQEEEEFERHIPASGSSVRFLERARVMNFEYAEVGAGTGSGAADGLLGPTRTRT